jgi:uncharacterized membrane protein
MKIRRSLDLIIISALALFTMLVALSGIRSAANQETLPVWFLPVGIGMILVLPGYVLVKAFLPSLDGATVLLLSVSLSIALDVVGILILDALPWGLTPPTWAVWLGGVTLLGCLLIAVKRFRHPGLDSKVIPTFKVNWRVWTPLLVAIVITLVSIFVARSAFVQTGTTFTQLWILPTSSEAPYTFQIGIRNYERQDKQYNLYVESQGRFIYSESGVEIASNETWTVYLSLNEKPVNPVSVYLYLSEAPDAVFRTVELAPIAFDGPLPPADASP